MKSRDQIPIADVCKSEDTRRATLDPSIHYGVDAATNVSSIYLPAYLPLPTPGAIDARPSHDAPRGGSIDRPRASQSASRKFRNRERRARARRWRRWWDCSIFRISSHPRARDTHATLSRARVCTCVYARRRAALRRRPILQRGR